MEDSCELCGEKVGENRNHLRLIRYRRDVRAGTKEQGLFCDRCTAKVIRAFETMIHESEELKHEKA